MSPPISSFFVFKDNIKILVEPEKKKQDNLEWKKIYFNTIELVDTGVWFDTYFKSLHKPRINTIDMVK